MKYSLSSVLMAAMTLVPCQAEAQEATAAPVAQTIETTVTMNVDKEKLFAHIDSIVRAQPEGYMKRSDDTIRKLTEVLSSDPSALVKVGRIYFNYYVDNTCDPPRNRFHVRDEDRALAFVERALKADSTYVPAYLFAGEVEQLQNQRSLADQWYQRGLKNCPLNWEITKAWAAYMAEDNETRAVQMLKDLGAKDPKFNADLHIGRMYIDLPGKVEYFYQAADYFAKCNITELNEHDITIYAHALYDMNKSEESLNVCKAGVERFPTNLSINEVYFSTLAYTKRFDEVLPAFERLKACEGYREQGGYELVLGNVYQETGKYEEALEHYQKVLALPDEQECHHKADRAISRVMAHRVTELKRARDYTGAAEFYKKFMDAQEKMGKLNGTMRNTYAQIFIEQSVWQKGEEKTATLKTADDICLKAIENEKQPNNKMFFMSQRMNIASKLDANSKSKESLAVPIAEEIVAFCEDQPAHKVTDDMFNMKKRACQMLMNHYAAIYNKSKGKEGGDQVRFYGDKVLELDPSNAEVQKIYDEMK